jgi:hypothetical protein
MCDASYSTLVSWLSGSTLVGLSFSIGCKWPLLCSMQSQRQGMGGNMALDWQVLLFASIALSMRIAAVCTKLDRVEVEGNSAPQAGESAKKVAPTMSSENARV